MKKTLTFVIFCLSFILSNAQNISVNTTGAANSTSSMFEVLQPSVTNNTIGIFARHSGAATNAYAIWGEATAGTNRTGVIGVGNAVPVVLGGGGGGQFFSGNVGAYGYGDATAASYGVYGKSVSTSGTGVEGLNTAVTGGGSGIGGFFSSLQTAGCGAGGSLLGSWYFGGAGVSGVTVGSAGFYGTIGQTTATGAGTGYGVAAASNCGVVGQELGNFTYSFGMAGLSTSTSNRVGGVLGLGPIVGTWGICGYRSSGGVLYGVYTTSVLGGPGGGRLASGNSITNSNGIGNGSYGSVMGGWTKGDVLGFTSSGKLYASYNIGNVYTSGVSADIITTKEKRIAVYSVTSNKVKVYADGISKLINGKIRITFDKDFIAVINTNKPTITITPNGECNGLYISSIEKDGFTVTELKSGKSNIEFSWIAIGTRIDGSTSLPVEISDMNFDINMQGVMFNENNTKDNSTPIWWDGKTLHFTEIPQSNVNQTQSVTPIQKETIK